MKSKYIIIYKLSIIYTTLHYKTSHSTKQLLPYIIINPGTLPGLGHVAGALISQITVVKNCDLFRGKVLILMNPLIVDYLSS